VSVDCCLQGFGRLGSLFKTGYPPLLQNVLLLIKKCVCVSEGWIRIRGARQYNPKYLHIDIPSGKLTVFAGPSGSCKSRPVFDTLFTRGQGRRCIEAFCAYACQFLECTDKPAVDRVGACRPPLPWTRPSMTGFNELRRLLLARGADLFVREAGAKGKDARNVGFSA
jgi:hypothetical protein